jgi:hypothetical protein
VQAPTEGVGKMAASDDARRFYVDVRRVETYVKADMP